MTHFFIENYVVDADGRRLASSKLVEAQTMAAAIDSQGSPPEVNKYIPVVESEPMVTEIGPCCVWTHRAEFHRTTVVKINPRKKEEHVKIFEVIVVSYVYPTDSHGKLIIAEDFFSDFWD